MSKYIVHKACELSNLRKSVRERLSQPDYLETQYIAQPKFDGCNVVFVVEHRPGDSCTVNVFSRTGETVLSMDHVVMAWLKLASLDGIGDLSGAYFGEAWAPDLDQPTISGLFRKQATTEETCRLQFVFFDMVTFDEWADGFSLRTYVERVESMSPFLRNIAQDGKSPMYPLQSYGYLRDHQTEGATAMDFARGLVAVGGYDGLIMRDPQGTWAQGDNGTCGEIVKIKPRDTYSFKVVGFADGRGKNVGGVGSLLLEDGEGKDVGSVNCGTDETRSYDYYWRELHGRFIDVEFMGVTAYNKLREPTYKGVRHDVLEAHIV